MKKTVTTLVLLIVGLVTWAAYPQLADAARRGRGPGQLQASCRQQQGQCSGQGAGGCGGQRMNAGRGAGMGRGCQMGQGRGMGMGRGMQMGQGRGMGMGRGMQMGQGRGMGMGRGRQMGLAQDQGRGRGMHLGRGMMLAGGERGQGRKVNAALRGRGRMPAMTTEGCQQGDGQGQLTSKGCSLPGAGSGTDCSIDKKPSAAAPVQQATPASQPAPVHQPGMGPGRGMGMGMGQGRGMGMGMGMGRGMGMGMADGATTPPQK